MKTDTSKKIIEYIAKKGQATAAELSDYLNLTPRAIFKQLRALIDKKRLSKFGRPPKVFYSLYKLAPPQEDYDILLIDDAVGSGATFNETAKQIRNKGVCKGKITGLAITGSFKGFDVISEI